MSILFTRRKEHKDKKDFIVINEKYSGLFIMIIAGLLISFLISLLFGNLLVSFIIIVLGLILQTLRSVETDSFLVARNKINGKEVREKGVFL